MNFEKIMSALFKDDPMVKQLKQTSLLTNSLTNPFIKPSMIFYEKCITQGSEETLIKTLLKMLQEKGQITKKIKIMAYWIQMFKLTKYDLSDIIMNKKLKIFTKVTGLLKQGGGGSSNNSNGNSNHHHHHQNSKMNIQENINEGNLQDYLFLKVLVPMYNYFMKLSVNEELFKLCVIGKVPDDDVFRRGTKIKFIWIFKLYNLINPLLPILESCAYILQKFPDLQGLRDISYQFYSDLLIMNDFIIEAIEEGAEDNFLLMPYFQMLQFYETMTEQETIQVKIQRVFVSLKNSSLKNNGQNNKSNHTNKNMQRQECKKPRKMKVDEQIRQQIQTQTLRVKLISSTMKNPKKDHSRLETDYNEKLEGRNTRILKTVGDVEDEEDREYMENEKKFTEKFRNLD